MSIITRGVSPTITVISETSSSSSSSEEGEGFEVDVNILSSDDTVYNNLDNSDYNNTTNSSARSGELSSAHSGSLTTFANNCSPPILIPTNFDIMKSTTRGHDGDGIIESLSSLDKSSKSRSSSKRASSPKSVRSRLTVTPIVEFCTDNNETVLGSVQKEDLSPVDEQIDNLESEVVIESTRSNNSKDMKEKICHILVDELGSSIETLRSGGSVLSTNTSASSSSGEQPKMFILPNELGNGGSSIETLRSGSVSEKIYILPQEEGSRLSLDQAEEEKSSASSSSGRSTPQEEQGLQLDIDKLQAYETIMKHLTAYEVSKVSVGVEAASPSPDVQKSEVQRVKRPLLDRVGNHLDKKTYQGMMKRSRRRRSRRLRKKK